MLKSTHPVETRVPELPRATLLATVLPAAQRNAGFFSSNYTQHLNKERVLSIAEPGSTTRPLEGAFQKGGHLFEGNVAEMEKYDLGLLRFSFSTTSKPRSHMSPRGHLQRIGQDLSSQYIDQRSAWSIGSEGTRSLSKVTGESGRWKIRYCILMFPQHRRTVQPHRHGK